MCPCRCRKLPKGLKDWQAFLDLKKRIDDFSESCPLLEMMANKAMKLRHWDRITNLTGHKFDIESDSFSLQNIMEAPLLKYKEDIEVSLPSSSCSLYRHLDVVPCLNVVGIQSSTVWFIGWWIDSVLSQCSDFTCNLG